MEGQKPGPMCVAHNHDFAKEGDFQPKVMKFSQNVKIGRFSELTSVTKSSRRWGFGGRVPSRQRLWGFFVLAPGQFFVTLWKK